MRADDLTRRWSSFGTRCAIVSNHQSFSYCELLEGVDRWTQALHTQGVEPGDCVLLRGDFSPAAIMALLALIRNQDIVLPVAPQNPIVSEDVQRSTGIGHEILNTHNPQFRTHAPAEPHPLVRQLRVAKQPGLVLCSSGSSGDVKASLHSVTRLLERFRECRPVLRTIAFFLFDHIGGVNTLFHVLCNGGTLVLEAERTVEAVCQTIAEHKVELLPTSPTFLKLLLMAGTQKRYDLSSLKMISYGSEVMPEAVLQELHDAFPGVRLKQTYGLTEVGIMHTQSESSDSLWFRVRGEDYETKIVGETLWIRTQSAMLGYLNAPSPFDDDGWFNTGDSVIVKSDYVRVLGRESEMISVGGEKVAPVEVESVIQRMPNVREVVVYAKPNALMGMVVAARVETEQPEPVAALEPRVRKFCQDRLAPYKVPMIVELADELTPTARYKKNRQVDCSIGQDEQ